MDSVVAVLAEVVSTEGITTVTLYGVISALFWLLIKLHESRRAENRADYDKRVVEVRSDFEVRAKAQEIYLDSIKVDRDRWQRLAEQAKDKLDSAADRHAEAKGVSRTEALPPSLPTESSEPTPEAKGNAQYADVLAGVVAATKDLDLPPKVAGEPKVEKPPQTGEHDKEGQP